MWKVYIRASWDYEGSLIVEVFLGETGGQVDDIVEIQHPSHSYLQPPDLLLYIIRDFENMGKKSINQYTHFIQFMPFQQTWLPLGWRSGRQVHRCDGGGRVWKGV